MTKVTDQLRYEAQNQIFTNNCVSLIYVDG